MINIVGLNKEKLADLTQSEQFSNFDFIPISKLRATSHINNPRAKDKDILLFLAYENDQLAGYLGILPDDVTVETEKLHFGWLSTLFVSPNFRGKQIAQKLLFAATEAYNDKLIITEFTESAGGLYKKIGLFESLNSKKAIRYYFQFNLGEILPQKRAHFRNKVKQLGQIDNLANIFIPYFGTNKNIKFEVHESTNQNIDLFLENISKNPIDRSSEEFSWMINHPWISTIEAEKKYLFSSFSEEYQMFWIVLKNKDFITTAFLCSIRNRHLKILYYFGDKKQITEVLPNVIKMFMVRMMTIYDEKLNLEITTNKKPKAIYKRQFERKYLIHKEFKKLLPDGFEFNFTDGDGDFSFT